MKKLIITLTLLTNALLHATTTAEVFRKYPNKYFIETGSYEGDGIQNALTAGFHEIYSIELSPYYYEQASDRFKKFENVHILYGDSSYILKELLQQIDAPATFWLDGHYSYGNTAKGNGNTPLLMELRAIQEHPINTHTILIDDIRCFGTADFDFIRLEEAIQLLKTINPNYIITFENGHVCKDVLVARPQSAEKGAVGSAGYKRDGYE